MGPQTFESLKQFWTTKYKERGDGVVGRVGESHVEQTKKIMAALEPVVPAGSYFPIGLDLGSGYGRFLPYLSNICGHVYAVDLVDSAVQRASEGIPNVTAVVVDRSYQLPVSDKTFDLLFCCLVLQHVVDAKLFIMMMHELRRVMKPGAKMIIIDNAIDQAPHVQSRPAEQLANSLQLGVGWSAKKITINTRVDDHWLIQGTFGG